MQDNYIKKNCIAFIKLIASFQVMLVHIINHFDLPINQTVYNVIYYFRGVPIFFCLSGFLIFFSIKRTQSFCLYSKKRFLRIYPELWFAVIIEILSILILFKNKISYIKLFLFALAQGTIFQFWTPSFLRNFGVGVPNGSLWTICVIIQFYFVAWFLYRLMNNKKLKTWIILFCLLVVLNLLLNYCIKNYIFIQKLYNQSIFNYLWIFYIGMFCANYFDIIIDFLKRYFVVFLIISFIIYFTKFDVLIGNYYLIWSLFLVIGLIGFSYKYFFINIKVDISYGIFLYHMIIVNIFYILNLKSWIYVPLIFIITIALSYLSLLIAQKITKIFK